VRGPGRGLPGSSRRGLVLLGTAVAAVAAAVVVYAWSGAWTGGDFRPHGDDRRDGAPAGSPLR
jgi:hypothetical protein